VDGKGKEDVQGIREELKKTAAMLAAVAKTGGVDMAEKVAPLVAKEPALAGLFGISDVSVARVSESRQSG
jgi:phage I-like protein